MLLNPLPVLIVHLKSQYPHRNVQRYFSIEQVAQRHRPLFLVLLHDVQRFRLELEPQSHRFKQLFIQDGCNELRLRDDLIFVPVALVLVGGGIVGSIGKQHRHRYRHRKGDFFTLFLGKFHALKFLDAFTDHHRRDGFSVQHFGAPGITDAGDVPVPPALKLFCGFTA